MSKVRGQGRLLSDRTGSPETALWGLCRAREGKRKHEHQRAEPSSDQEAWPVVLHRQSLCLLWWPRTWLPRWAWEPCGPLAIFCFWEVPSRPRVVTPQDCGSPLGCCISAMLGVEGASHSRRGPGKRPPGGRPWTKNGTVHVCSRVRSWTEGGSSFSPLNRFLLL